MYMYRLRGGEARNLLPINGLGYNDAGVIAGALNVEPISGLGPSQIPICY